MFTIFHLNHLPPLNGNNRTGMKYFFLFFLSAIACLASAQADTLSSYSVGLILPLHSISTTERLLAFTENRDPQKTVKIQLNEDAVASLDFYQGVIESLNASKEAVKINLHVYDCYSSDSVTAEILKNPELRKLDVIIGPISTSNAKLVASFCKKNQILNIQPFTPSKSMAQNNPYHIKLVPTIHVHVDNMFQSILDSFPSANIIIYSPDNEIATITAQRFDSLFRDYNNNATEKFTVTMLNTKDMMVDGKKTRVSDVVSSTRRNVWIITSFDDIFVNESLRLLFDKKDKADIVVYGMPTWLDGDIMRLDYINDYRTRISGAFYADTAKGKGLDFIDAYKHHYAMEPNEKAYLGYDVMGFTSRCLGTYGKDFPLQITTQRYTGLAYIFDVMREENADGSVNYYENRHVNVFMVDDYGLKKIW